MESSCNERGPISGVCVCVWGGGGGGGGRVVQSFSHLIYFWLKCPEENSRLLN